MRALLVFLAVALLDALWATYLLLATGRRAVLAGLTAAGLMLCTGAVIVSYVREPQLLGPAALGAFVGTWLVVRHG